MGARYAQSGSDSVAAPQTVLGLTGGTGLRFKIYDWMVGSTSTAPADVALLWAMARSQEAGSGGSALTPEPLDPADAAAEVATQLAPTTEPELKASSIPLIEVGVNERATFRWVAAPGGELICPATASEGMNLEVNHATDTDTVYATIHHEE